MRAKNYRKDAQSINGVQADLTNPTPGHLLGVDDDGIIVTRPDDTISGIHVSSATPDNRDVFRYDETSGKYVFKHTNEYNSTQDGITFTQDEDRTFFKDDFSVDSSSQYTNLLNCPFVINNGVMTLTGTTYKQFLQIPYDFVEQSRNGSVKVQMSLKPASGSSVLSRTLYGVGLYYTEIDYILMGIKVNAQGQTSISTYGYGIYSAYNTSGKFIKEYSPSDVYTFEVVIGSNSISITNLGIGNHETLLVTGPLNIITPESKLCIAQRYPEVGGTTVYDVCVSPSVSYADDFTSDTTERYQPVLGTVAYDDTNKRMNVTTATGANGKASGRLKSYKFTEGSQIYDVVLPTGADGDFITLVTHSANGQMTDGIGVGLQSDGAGNWNLATLSGTTVTEGADSGLVDGNTARIEIEKDITGAYWYYIYDASGTKPTTATGKLFTTLTEGYTGWYANGAGAETQTYAIDNISIRAESIVGRTNIEVEEPFWFRDEFGEDSMGRYNGSPLSYTYDDSIDVLSLALTSIAARPLYTEDVFSEVTAEYRFKYSTLSTSSCISLRWCSEGILDITNGNTLRTSGTGYSLQYRLNEGPRRIDYVINDVATTLMELPTYPFEQGTIYKLKLVSSNGVHSIYIAPDSESYGDPFISFEDNRLTQGKVIFARSGAGNSAPDVFELHSIEISGTRVYNKPIHRGAMLETFWDGTQEVVGTTFIDDCQWDRSAEYIQANTTSFTFDTVNGGIVETETGDGDKRSDQLKIKTRFGSAHYHYKFTKIADASYIGVFTFCDQRETSHTCPIDNTTSCPNAELYFVCVHFVSPNTFLKVFRRTVGGASIIGNAAIPTISVGETHTIDILHNAGSGNIRVFYDGIQKINTTDTTYTNGYCGPTRIYSDSTATKFSEIQIIGVSPDATNGIAACIPPIGGGARYDTAEEVYYEIPSNTVKHGEYAGMVSAKSTIPITATITSQNITDSTSIRTDGLTTESVAVNPTQDDHIIPIVLKHSDRNDTIKVSISNDSDATMYVETIALAPIYEVE